MSVDIRDHAATRAEMSSGVPRTKQLEILPESTSIITRGVRQSGSGPRRAKRDGTLLSEIRHGCIRLPLHFAVLTEHIPTGVWRTCLGKASQSRPEFV